MALKKSKARRRTFPLRMRKMEIGFMRKLQQREIGEWRRPLQGITSHVPNRFENIKPQQEFDTFLDFECSIWKILALRDVMVVLTNSGLCSVLRLKTKKHIGFLNRSPGEVVIRIFHNKYNESIITVSVHKSDQFPFFRCTTTLIENIRRNQLDDGFTIFETDGPGISGFFDINDIIGRAVIYNDRTCVYKVYELKNYSLLYCIPNSHGNIEKAVISPGVLLLLWKINPEHPLLKVEMHSIDDNKAMGCIQAELYNGNNIKFVSHCDGKLLVKQVDNNLKIIDVQSSTMVDVPFTDFMEDSFHMLHEKHLILCVRDWSVELRNLRGEILTTFNHLHYYSGYSPLYNYISRDESFIISFCSEEPQEEFGSLNMTHIPSGKCLGKVSRARLSEDCRLSEENLTSLLEDITCIFYDEDQDVLYTGYSGGDSYNHFCNLNGILAGIWKFNWIQILHFHN